MAKISVDSSQGLMSALKVAQGGDTILLASGTYTGLAFSNLKFANGVTITSADPAHQAVLTNFNINDVSGLNFSNLVFSATTTSNYYAFDFRTSSNLNFDHIHVHGSLDGNAANDPSGVFFQNTNNVTFTNSEFQQLLRGIVFGQSTNIRLEGNHVHHMRSDGFDFGEVKNVKVLNNSFHDTNLFGDDHPDAIQFWTAGTKTASQDILISGNVITRGAGGFTQGIYLRDELGNLPFERVTITNNLVVGTGYNGIRVNGVKDLVVTGNELVSLPGELLKTFMYIQNSQNVTSMNNKAISMDFVNVTNLNRSGDTTNSPVSDNGNAAIQKWNATHTSTPPATSITGTFLSDKPDVPKASLPATTVASPAGAQDPLVATTANPDVTGNALNNKITGTYSSNKLSGMEGNDTIDGLGGADTISGGAGDDLYMVPNDLAKVVELAGQGIDTVNAKCHYVLPDNVENLVISTTALNGWFGTGNSLGNVMTGNEGNNKLFGLAGNDTLSGGGGNDELVGGAGNDRLTGGAGNDLFRFDVGSGRDVIVDAGRGDMIDIRDYMKAGIKAVLQDRGADVVINFANGDSVTLLNHHASDLTVSWQGWVL